MARKPETASDSGKVGDKPGGRRCQARYLARMVLRKAGASGCLRGCKRARARRRHRPPPDHAGPASWGSSSGLLTIVLIASVVGAGLFSIARREFAEPGPLQADRTVIIEKGSTTEEIVDVLNREGVIARPTFLWAVLLFRDVQSKFVKDEAENDAPRPVNICFARAPR